MKKNLFAAIALGGALVAMTGCTALIPDNTMKARTGQTLGVSQDNVTIDQRHNGVLRSDYKAATSNEIYSCYMTSFLGLTTSDAICNTTNGDAKTSPQVKQATPKKTSTSCNALTKAAGKC